MASDPKHAIVLLSGGLDSATIAAIARNEGYAITALSIRYGQRHAIELDAARAVADSLDIEHLIIQDIDLRQFGGSALTANIAVPKSESRPTDDSIPATYVPARNTIFLSLALGLAEVRGANAIFIGANAVDYSGYPDCRPEFIAAFQKLANVATKATTLGSSIIIKAPLLELSKAQIIQLGHELGVNYQLTTSCYDPSPEHLACGECDSCHIRKTGFIEAGVPDPTSYVEREYSQ